MNEYPEIKELLDKYYDVKTTEADDRRLREYFTSGNVADELQCYRSIFAYLQNEREHPSDSTPTVALPVARSRRIGWRYAVAAAAACLLGTTFLVRKNEPVAPVPCTGTYVMVNGVCYDDVAYIKRYAVKTIDLMTQPFENGCPIEELNCLND
jgi:hypothetical protein